MSKFEEKNIVYGLKPVAHFPRDKSLGKLILDSLKLHGNKNFMIDAETKETVTFKWMLEKTVRAAESMKSLGIKKDDVISIISENHLNFFVPLIAAMYLGATVAPINHSYTIHEILHTMNISKPKIIFCHSTIADKVLELKAKASFLQHLITLESDVKLEGVENFEEFLNRSSALKRSDDIDVAECNPETQTCLIMSSSGTTGLPKGVMLTHWNIICLLAYRDDPRLTYVSEKMDENVDVGFLPFFHAYGLIMVLVNILRGTRVVMLSHFDFELFLRSIQEYKISSLTLVPPIMLYMAKSSMVDDFDLSSIKVITCGAAPLSREIQEIVQKKFGLKLIRHGYGLTEATAAVMITPLHDPRSEQKIGSAGVITPHMKCKVVDVETGTALGPNKRGELCFKGDLIMKGYCGNPKATRETFDANGWLHTGDVAYYDDDGYFYIVDRIKELIKYKGFQVAPAELEALLLTHPKIMDAAVIGKPQDEKVGELPMAFVVKQPDEELTEKEVQDFIAGLVSNYKWLRGGVQFVDDIPKNPSGKILRRYLKDMIKQKSKL